MKILQEADDLRTLRAALQSVTSPHRASVLQVLGIVQSVLRGVSRDEILTDDWPEFKVVLTKSSHCRSEEDGGKETPMLAGDTAHITLYYTHEEALTAFLSQPQVLPWHYSSFIFSGVPVMDEPLFRQYAKDYGDLDNLFTCTTVTANNTTQSEIALPEGFYYKHDVKPEVDQMIDAGWPLGNEMILQMACDNAAKFPCTYIYTEDLLQTPAAHVFVNSSGAISLLNVHPHYRNKGLSACLLNDITGRMHSQGMTPWANIQEGKDSVLKLFKRCGFEEIDKRIWLMYIPKKVTEEE